MKTLILISCLFSAKTPEMPQPVRSLLSLEGADYARVRNALIEALADNTELRTELERFRKGSRIDGDRWRAAALIEAVLVHATDRTLDAKLAHLKGIDPRTYLTWRNPEPSVNTELIRLGVPAAALIERYLRLESFWELVELNAEELAALRVGIVDAVGKIGGELGARFIEYVLTDDAASLSLRQLAAESLGHTQTTFAEGVLRHLLADETTPESLRASATCGAAALRTRAGLDLLVFANQPAMSTEVRTAAIRGLGLFASRWAWEALGTPKHELRYRAMQSLVDGLLANSSRELELTYEHSLLAVPDIELTTMLQAAKTKPSTSKAQGTFLEQILQRRAIAARPAALRAFHFEKLKTR